ncbi:hypothetical protein GcC1_210051 [Golovinomyces cichoracearum]|uniref:Uncharacterized protein n=1 Tax=Golovinomyces cichoracearum TaxID=62708 RepID=A0A420HAT3_9PEZI|nr:hypothetical protein GcC1_210051 [Golovinomyces cichoracearum]
MIEKTIDILQRQNEWPEKLSRATLEVNKRVINHLLYSPSQIFLGFNPVGSLEINFPVKSRQGLTSSLLAGLADVISEEEDHANRKYEKKPKNVQIYTRTEQQIDIM